MSAIVLGLALSVLSFVLSAFLATSLVNRPGTASVIQVTYFAILAGALINVGTVAFVGVESIELNRITLICQSVM